MHLRRSECPLLAKWRLSSILARCAYLWCCIYPADRYTFLAKVALNFSPRFTSLSLWPSCRWRQGITTTNFALGYKSQYRRILFFNLLICDNFLRRNRNSKEGINLSFLSLRFAFVSYKFLLMNSHPMLYLATQWCNTMSRAVFHRAARVCRNIVAVDHDEANRSSRPVVNRRIKCKRFV